MDSTAGPSKEFIEMEPKTQKKKRKVEVQFSEPDAGQGEFHTLRLKCDSEKEWIRAVCTLLPSNRGDNSNSRYPWSSLSPSIAHTVTLPRRPGMNPRDNIVINLRRQLSNASHRKRIRSKSARVARPSHSFQFLSKKAGIDLHPDGASDGDYISLPSDVDESDSVSGEQDQWQHLLAIPSMPVPMAEKRRLRTN